MRRRETLPDLTRRHGTLLALDETHTQVVEPGGAAGLLAEVRGWGH